MHKQFKKEAPQGTLSKKDFKAVMKGMGFEDPFIGDLLFAGFDQDRDGLVTFKEFITALSILTRGTPDEKIECTHWCSRGSVLWVEARSANLLCPFLVTFHMYDLENVGYITRESFLPILESFFKVRATWLSALGSFWSFSRFC